MPSVIEHDTKNEVDYNEHFMLSCLKVHSFRITRADNRVY